MEKKQECLELYDFGLDSIRSYLDFNMLHILVVDF